MAGIRKLGALAAGALAALAVGCHPFGMGIFTPVPVQPWVAERMEQKYTPAAGDITPIMPPIRDGYPLPLCEDPPGDHEILRIFKLRRGVPYVYEQFFDDVVFIKNRLKDTIDPPRFFPLVGMAQLHHCHWEVVIKYTETQQSDWPFPTYIKRHRTEVVYIDKDHLHLYVGPNPDMQRQILFEMTKYGG